MEKIIIKRDRSFIARGIEYRLTRSGPYGSHDSEWVLQRADCDDDRRSESFHSISDVRAHVSRCLANGWEITE